MTLSQKKNECVRRIKFLRMVFLASLLTINYSCSLADSDRRKVRDDDQHDMSNPLETRLLSFFYKIIIAALFSVLANFSKKTFP